MSRTLTISNSISKPEPDSYTLSITTYAGDGDSYSTHIIAGFRSYDATEMLMLHELLDLFHLMKAAYPYGRGGCGDTYEEVSALQTFRDWFVGDDTLREDIEGFIERTDQYDALEWPYSGYYEQEETIDEWKLTYYDVDSNAFEVIIND